MTAICTTEVQVVASANDDFEARMRQEHKDAHALLASLGYKKKNHDAQVWKELIDIARRSLFLRQPNRYQVKGTAATHALVHTFYSPNQRLAEMLRDEVSAAQPDVASIRILQPADTLPDRIVFVHHTTLMVPEVVTAMSSRLVVKAAACGAAYQGWRPEWKCDAAEALLPARSELTPVEKRRLSFRTEFLTDVVLARLVLAPFAWRWADSDSLVKKATPKRPAVYGGMDHTVHIHLKDHAPALDDLRWLLWQITDMHVAAQSLDYSACYTGERMHYDLMDRLEPSDSGRAVMRDVFKRIGSVHNIGTQRLAPLGKMLGSPLECVVYAEDDDDFEEQDAYPTEQEDAVDGD